MKHTAAFDLCIILLCTHELRDLEIASAVLGLIACMLCSVEREHSMLWLHDREILSENFFPRCRPFVHPSCWINVLCPWCRNSWQPHLAQRGRKTSDISGDTLYPSRNGRVCVITTMVVYWVFSWETSALCCRMGNRKGRWMASLLKLSQRLLCIAREVGGFWVRELHRTPNSQF